MASNIVKWKKFGHWWGNLLEGRPSHQHYINHVFMIVWFDGSNSLFGSRFYPEVSDR